MQKEVCGLIPQIVEKAVYNSQTENCNFVNIIIKDINTIHN